MAENALRHAMNRTNRGVRKRSSRWQENPADAVTKGRLQFEAVQEAAKSTGRQAAEMEQAKKSAIRRFWQKQRYKKAYQAAKNGEKTLLPTYRNRQKIWTQESYMKQGWLFATRKNRTLFSNCKRRMENSLLLLQCFMAGVMLKKFSMKEPNRRSLFRKKNAIVKQWLKIRRGKYPNAMK